GISEGDLALADIVAVRANPEESEQHGEDDRCIADNVALAHADLVVEGDGEGHHQGDEGAGDEAEGEDRLFQGSLLKSRLRLRRHFTAASGGFVVILLDDFGARSKKSCFWVAGSGDEAKFFA